MYEINSYISVQIGEYALRYGKIPTSLSHAHQCHYTLARHPAARTYNVYQPHSFQPHARYFSFLHGQVFVTVFIASLHLKPLTPVI